MQNYLHISKKNSTLGKLPAAMRHSPQCTCLVFINMSQLRAKRLKPLIDCFSVVYREKTPIFYLKNTQ